MVDKLNHTPGPWKVNGNLITQPYITAPGKIEVADILTEETADALIIAAAPDMYEALRGNPYDDTALFWVECLLAEYTEAIDYHENNHPDLEAQGTMLREVKRLISKGRMALKKAETGDY